MTDDKQPVSSIEIQGNVGPGAAVGPGASVTAGIIAGRDVILAGTYIQNIVNLYIQGLHKLPVDYGSGIKNFLREYTGIGEERVPFGGRDDELTKLDAWWQDEQSPAYALLIAEAGRGKSALLVQWAAQMTAREWAEVIFIPISIRFQTNSQTAVFATLAAHLSELHGESWNDKSIQMSAEEYRLLSRGLLEKPLPDGKGLLIILDGLDEASGWQPGPHLFPPQLPPGIKLITSARVHGRTDKQGWLNQLHWHKGRAYDLTLPFLSRQGVADVLVQMGNPLDALASEVDVVSTLYHLSEGDPLLVRLYVEQLVEQTTRLPGNKEVVAWLETAKPGLGGYFEGWWRDQRQLWGKESPLREQATQEFFTLLSVALGSLSQTDVQALLPTLSTWVLEEIVESLGRLVIGNGREQAFTFNHPRLGYYFYDQLGPVEKQSWEQRFVAYGEQTLNALRAGGKGKPAPSAYMIRHYTAHLDRIKAADSAFDALVCQEWAEAWNALDGTYAGFLADIKQVRQRAVARYDLGMMIWCDLCQSSITTLSSNIPPDLLAQAAIHGLLSHRQALITVKQISPFQHQSEALTLLAPHLPLDLLAEALITASHIGDEESRATALTALAPHLPLYLLDEALIAARTVDNEEFRARALTALAPHLPPEQQMVILAEALTAARYTDDEEFRARALTALAPHLPPEQQMVILAEALTAARSIDNEEFRARALTTLAPHLPPEQQMVILAEALTAARSIDDEGSRAYALGALAPHLPPDPLAKALTAARSIGHEWSRARALGALAPHLPPDLLAEALTAARTVDDEEFRAHALTALVPHLPPEQQMVILAEALTTARSIGHEGSRTDALTALTPHMPPEQQMVILAEALTAASHIGDEGSRADVLTALAPHMPSEQQMVILAEALTAARSIDNEEFRARALTTLAPHLGGFVG